MRPHGLKATKASELVEGAKVQTMRASEAKSRMRRQPAWTALVLLAALLAVASVMTGRAAVAPVDKRLGLRPPSEARSIGELEADEAEREGCA